MINACLFFVFCCFFFHFIGQLGWWGGGGGWWEKRRDEKNRYGVNHHLFHKTWFIVLFVNQSAKLSAFYENIHSYNSIILIFRDKGFWKEKAEWEDQGERKQVKEKTTGTEGERAAGYSEFF